MEKRLVPIDPAVLVLIQGAFGKNGALQPFAREIMLIECHIAGTAHRDIKDIEPALEPGSLLILRREPDNRHDPLAIQIFDTQSRLLGYVPRVKNEALARLMDAGKLLFGRLESKQWLGSWLKADIRICLRDL